MQVVHGLHTVHVLHAAAAAGLWKGRRPRALTRETSRMRRRRERRERRRFQTRVVEIWPLPKLEAMPQSDQSIDSDKACWPEPTVTEPKRNDSSCNRTRRCRGGGDNRGPGEARANSTLAYDLLREILAAFDSSGVRVRGRGPR
jgi:hypothetical protein